MDTETLKWGFISTARINRALIDPLRISRRNELLAVASRTQQGADAYAQEYGIPRAYGNYDDILNDLDIDVVYIPLPNSLHAEWTIKAAQAGKHILCEKPLATNLEEVEAMIDATEKAGVILAESRISRGICRFSVTVAMVITTPTVRSSVKRDPTGVFVAGRHLNESRIFSDRGEINDRRALGASVGNTFIYRHDSVTKLTVPIRSPAVRSSFGCDATCVPVSPRHLNETDLASNGRGVNGHRELRSIVPSSIPELGKLIPAIKDFLRFLGRTSKFKGDNAERRQVP